MTIAGDLTIIAIVKQQSQYYRDIDPTIVIVWMNLALSLALTNDLACVVFGQLIMFAVLSLYFDVTWPTLHAARFLSIISSLFQLNDAEMLSYGGFPVHILTISNSSSILQDLS